MQLAIPRLLLAGLLLVAGASGSTDELSSKARTALKKALADYAAEPTGDAREAILPRLLIHGRKGVEYLASLAEEPDADANALVSVLARAPEVLGFDLLDREVSEVPEHAPRYFGPGEIVLLRKGDLFAGFAVARDARPASGEVRILWWRQRKGGRTLAERGGEAGEVIARGTPAARPMRPNTGYAELDYAFEVAGIPVTIRFVGPAWFRCRFPGGGVAIALSGSDDPRKLSSSDDRIRFQESYPVGLARVRVLLQQYLFRTIPGCEPLPLSEAERVDFAQYEMAQVLVRQTGPEAEPIVVVKLLEPDRLGLAPQHVDYIANFVNEILRVARERIVVMGGSAECPESNRFYIDGRWVRPPKALIELLRASFPEAC